MVEVQEAYMMTSAICFNDWCHAYFDWASSKTTLSCKVLDKAIKSLKFRKEVPDMGCVLVVLSKSFNQQISVS